MKKSLTTTFLVGLSSMSLNAQLVINEVQSANVDMYLDASVNYGGWIEIYNPSSSAVSLADYYVSDDELNLKRFNLRGSGTVSAKGYKVVWFDHNDLVASQVNFKLDCDGGAIYLSNKAGVVVSMVSYPKAKGRMSYARKTDGGDEWMYTWMPTPAATNVSSVFAQEQVPAPVVDCDGRLYSGGLTVNVEIPEGATLRYTTDGTTPTMENGMTSKTGKFSMLNSTRNYRFRLFKDGMLPSEVVTRSYIYKDKAYTLPIVSVVTDPKNLYDDLIGVYVRGTNGRTGNGQSTPCNWNMDWERPVNFEYMTADGKCVYNHEVDFEMCGGWSRANLPHSFKLKANKVYGDNYLAYQFFDCKPSLKHKALQIRNGGNDNTCRLRDAALQEIIRRSGVYVDGQAWQPVHNFINGEYIGMLNMREPNNKHFAYANYGIDTDLMDQFEMSPDSGYIQKEGTDEAFLRLYDLSRYVAEDNVYEQVCEIVDVDEYVNYMAIQFWLGNSDWPQNNLKGFRDQNDGRFHFVLFDLDMTFRQKSPFTGFESKKTYTFDLIYDTNTRKTDEIKLVTIFLNMLKNKQFAKKFVDSFCIINGSVFGPQRCQSIIKEMAEEITGPLALEGKSPTSTMNALLNEFTSTRQDNMIANLKSYSKFSLSSKTAQKIQLSSNVEGAKILVNDIEVPMSTFDGALFAPAIIRVEAPNGYDFQGWAMSMPALVDGGSTWSYYDMGSLDGQNWTSESFVENSSWKSGMAPLGYFTSDQSNARGYKTTMNYGSDANNKRPTYYFRRELTLDEKPLSSDYFTVDFTVDDGLIVYVNGVEAGRYNMPSGSVGYSTYASSYAPANPDKGSMSLEPSLFHEGRNVIAVEVHNNSANSTDVYFDMVLKSSMTKEDATYYTKEKSFEMPTSGNHSYVAVFKRRSGEALESPIVVNEVSADNNIFVNEYFKKGDWIELYNQTSMDVDIEGMFISDNSDKPTKYKVVGSDGVNTIVPANGYLLVWADKLEAKDQLHATFKLDANGGKVILTSADQSWSNVLEYPAHAWNETVGRYPDGGNDVYIMNPTLASSNRIRSYSLRVDVSGEGASNGIAIENGMTMACVNGKIVVTSETNVKRIVVYDVMGRSRMVETSSECDVDGLANGLYVAVAVDEMGNRCSLRFVK